MDGWRKGQELITKCQWKMSLDLVSRLSQIPTRQWRSSQCACLQLPSVWLIYLLQNLRGSLDGFLSDGIQVLLQVVSVLLVSVLHTFSAPRRVSLRLKVFSRSAPKFSVKSVELLLQRPARCVPLSLTLCRWSVLSRCSPSFISLHIYPSLSHTHSLPPSLSRYVK